jgi:SAM-dependent methyltransferase
MESDFKIYPSTLPEKDYWRQVKRTVHGVPVSDEQIMMIVQAIRGELGLNIGGQDILLDLGCGNGALSALLFDSISGFHGVDYSEFLISVAQRDFQNEPDFTFSLGDVLEYVQREQEPSRYSKALCYGCFSYFPDPDGLLKILNHRFLNLESIFIGNLPDRDLAHLFYKNGLPDEAEMLDYDSKIGVWRTREQFSALALRNGWETKFSVMPTNFYASHYRYDVLLTRKL